jgi:hypothetical protein
LLQILLARIRFRANMAHMNNSRMLETPMKFLVLANFEPSYQRAIFVVWLALVVTIPSFAFGAAIYGTAWLILRLRDAIRRERRTRWLIRRALRYSRN